MAGRTRVVMLGTGTPNPVPDRSGPCVAVIVDDRAYLVDFGSGVVRQAEKAHRMGLNALDAQNLQYAFCTHLHSDHTMGLADLLLTPWVLQREDPLKLLGPKGIKEMARHIVEAYMVDIAGRKESASPVSEHGWKIDAEEVHEGVVFSNDQITVEAFPVNHPPFESYGYKFTTPDRVVVISGDTTPCDNILKYAKGCDILVHEVFSATGVKKRSPDWLEYHTSVHTSSNQLGEIAAKVRPGILVLYHQLFMCGENEAGSQVALQDREQEMLAEIRENWNGPVFSAKDLEIY